MKKYGGEKMNIAFARNEYANTKSNAMTSKAENYEAVKMALSQLSESMTALKSAESAEQREPFFEQCLTSIYFLQKCLDFEAGGDLAKNLFKVYEFSRQAVLDYVLREKGSRSEEHTSELQSHS